MNPCTCTDYGIVLIFARSHQRWSCFADMITLQTKRPTRKDTEMRAKVLKEKVLAMRRSSLSKDAEA